VLLRPFSNLNFVVVWRVRRPLSDDERAIQKAYAESNEKHLHVCGAPARLHANATIDVHVSCPVPSRLRQPKVQQLKRGRPALFRGQLAFEQVRAAIAFRVRRRASCVLQSVLMPPGQTPSALELAAAAAVSSGNASPPTPSRSGAPTPSTQHRRTPSTDLSIVSPATRRRGARLRGTVGVSPQV
jgi:hypothetical protein